jgi:CarboxypepD_reg-like domain
VVLSGSLVMGCGLAATPLYGLKNMSTFLIKIFSSIILIQGIIFAQDECIVIGRILDTQTKSGVQYANVIIHTTSLGATTDSTGYFTVINIPEGNYEFSVTCIGYRPLTKNFELSSDSINYINIELEYGTHTASDAQKDIQNGIIRLYLFGWPIYSPKYTELAEKYGFEIGITGCYPAIVDPYNEVMYEYLETKYGKGWREKFEKEMIEIEEEENNED